MNEIADVLDKAHDELLIRGWTRWSTLNDLGNVCALGAISCAEPSSVSHNFYPMKGLGRAAADALAASLGFRGHARTIRPLIDLQTWNDAPGRTLDDVLDAFRMAAKQQREQGDQ